MNKIKKKKKMGNGKWEMGNFTTSMSHMTTFSTVLCLSISLAVEPSPPPIIKMVFGLKIKHR